MSIPKVVTLINEDECIGDSLDTINANFLKLDTLVSTLSTSVFGSVNATKTVYTGNGITAAYTIDGISINASNYRVDIDGVLQEPDTDYTITPNTADTVTITFTTSPPNGSKIVIVSSSSLIIS